jgi:hypothetical protein
MELSGWLPFWYEWFRRCDSEQLLLLLSEEVDADFSSWVKFPEALE